MPLWHTSDLTWLSDGWNSDRDQRCCVLNLPNSGRHSLPSCYIPQEGQKERTPERRAACQMWIKQFPDTLRLSLRADQIWATKRVKISGVLSRRKCNQRAAEGPHGTEIKSYITSRVFCRLEKKPNKTNRKFWGMVGKHAATLPYNSGLFKKGCNNTRKQDESYGTDMIG